MHFAVFPSTFWIQEDEIRDYVRSEMSQHCGESFHAACIANWETLVSPNWTLDSNHSIWVTASVKLWKYGTKGVLENYSDPMTLSTDLYYSLSFCFLPVHLSDPQRVEVSEPFNCSRREKGWTEGLWFSMSHSGVLYRICCCRVCSKSRQFQVLYIAKKLECICSPLDLCAA